MRVSEIASIHAQIETFVLSLGGRVRRIHDALEHLRHETSLRLRLERQDPAAIDRWLEEDRFAVDDDGFFQSLRRLEQHRAGALGPDAVTQFWAARDRDDPGLRARLYALRDVGPRLLELQRGQPGVAWIYYQDAANAAVVFPYFDLVKILPSSFDWRTYHTYVSVTPAADPDRTIRWTPPNIDYGGEGLITSASIPLYRDDALLGLWSIDVPLRTIHRDCIHERIAPDQRNFIVDLDGYLVDHESIATEIDKKVGSILRKHVSAIGGDFATLDVRELARSGPGTIELSGPGGERLLAAYRCVPELDWLFIATFPKSKMVAAINAKVIEAFERIRRGDLSFRIDPSVSDEVHQLVAGCNAMAQALQADLKERERTSLELQAAKAAAEAASAAKDRFMAALSHELRTPLSPVLAAVSSLQRDPRVPGALHDILELIRRNVALEAHLIDDLLDVNAISRGKVRFTRRIVDAHEVLERSYEICRPDLDAAGLDLVTRHEAEEHHVDADPARLQQALWNLLRNAIKYTPPDGDRRIIVRSWNPTPGVLRLEVQDSGIGIAAEDVGRIFRAFEQVDRTRGGLGLGLVVAKAITEAHGGTIDVNSPGPGQGSTFGLQLATCAPQPAPAPARERAAHAAPPRGRLRLLLVEDNVDTAEVLAASLALLGHSVATATTVVDALRRVDREAFDLVISDLGLPDMSGYDLARALRSRGGVACIAVSGHGYPEDIRRSLEAGFLRHLVKPIEVGELEDVLEEVTSQRHGPPDVRG